MTMEGQYAEQWQDYRRRHLTAFLGCFVGLPLIVLLGALAALIFGLHSPCAHRSLGGKTIFGISLLPTRQPQIKRTKSL
jgi:hypothetical protein